MFLYFAVELHAKRHGLQSTGRSILRGTGICNPFSLRAGWKAKQQPLLYPADVVDHELLHNRSRSTARPRENPITELRRKEFFCEREGYSEMV